MRPSPAQGLTCWKESSKSVCRETLIFTWLGSAFDWNQTQALGSESAQLCPPTEPPAPLPAAPSLAEREAVLILPTPPPLASVPNSRYSHDTGSGTGDISSESFGRKPQGNPPAYSYRSKHTGRE